MEKTMESLPKYFIPKSRDEIIFKSSPIVNVPVRHLRGIQFPKDYTDEQTRSVREALAQHGIAFLRANPIWAIFSPAENSADIFVYDGHHRSRYAPAYGIDIIPTHLVDVTDIAQEIGYQPRVLTEMLSAEAQKVSRVFSKKMDRKGGCPSMPIRGHYDHVSDFMFTMSLTNPRFTHSYGSTSIAIAT